MDVLQGVIAPFIAGLGIVLGDIAPVWKMVMAFTAGFPSVVDV